MKIHKKSSCRICGSPLKEILDLGSQKIGNLFSEDDSKIESAPLELVRCYSPKSENSCGLVQLRHSVEPEYLYSEYWYKSGINSTMKNHLVSIAKAAEKRKDLKAGDVVLDIGCNDGTLLLSYTIKGLKLVGIDPAKNITENARKKGINVVNDFFSSDAYFRLNIPKPKIITSIAMFYDLETPASFVNDIKKILDNDGIWIMELSYLPLMLSLNSFDTICHEHLEYYALFQVEFMLKQNGLEAFDIEFNDSNGGSFRLYVNHSGKRKYSQKLEETRISEEKLKLSTDEPYKKFCKNIEILKTELVDFVRSENEKGKKIFVYGASTKGNTLLQYYGLDYKMITRAADRNPDKWGKMTPGSRIPIISEEEARKMKPDYFLVLPWHFFGEFAKREHEFMENGGKFILPLPEFKIIGKDFKK